jgi:disulfide bond formation protein DsbB
MSSFASSLIYLMALGTVVLDVALVIKVLALFHAPSRARIIGTGRRYGLLAIFILSTLAVAGTLIMQYAGGLQPCLFCWWQRIFMYPVPLISLIAILKGKDISDVADYILTLSVFGFAVALYQHLLQILPSGSLIPCDAANECAVRSVFEFNFVTIPWMAMTVFAALFLIALLARKPRV